MGGREGGRKFSWSFGSFGEGGGGRTRVGANTYFSETVWSSCWNGFCSYGAGEDRRRSALGGAIDAAAVCHGGGGGRAGGIGGAGREILANR